LAKSKGFNISHVDCTLICEFPKIGPHTLNMRHKVSELLNIEEDRVSVKATTSERLGFTGREEGIACMATATLVKS
jgi:2-C-methyl-D-erythritol 4-phosphate cytidylyltransferase/2-C-methyl-D-erythritol 2,4-cyclodiphosphate synthase